MEGLVWILENAIGSLRCVRGDVGEAVEGGSEGREGWWVGIGVGEVGERAEVGWGGYGEKQAHVV